MSGTESKKKNGDCLFSTYPLYTLCWNADSKYLLAGGGGGKSKTGIPNGIKICRVDDISNSIESIEEKDLGGDVIMSIGRHPILPDYFAVGIGNKCTLVQLNIANTSIDEIIPPFETVAKQNALLSNIKYNDNSSPLRPNKLTSSPSSSSSSSSLSPSSSPSPTKPMKKDKKEKEREKEKEKEREKEKEDVEEEDNIAFQKISIFSHTGDLLATSGDDGIIKVWECINAKKNKKSKELVAKQSFQGHTDTINALSFSPSDKFIASSSLDRTCRVWSLGFNACIATLNLDASLRPDFRGCAYLSDDVLVTMHAEHRKKCYISVWDTHTFVLTRKVQVASTPGTALALSALFMAVGCSDGALHLIHPTTLSVIRSYPSHHHMFVTCVQFSPDAHTLASTSGDYSVKVISLTNVSTTSSLSAQLLLLVAGIVVLFFMIIILISIYFEVINVPEMARLINKSLLL